MIINRLKLDTRGLDASSLLQIERILEKLLQEGAKRPLLSSAGKMKLYENIF